MIYHLVDYTNTRNNIASVFSVVIFSGSLSWFLVLNYEEIYSINMCIYSFGRQMLT